MLGAESFAPLTPGQELTLAGFGRKAPCVPANQDAEGNQPTGWAAAAGDALKLGKNRVRASFYSEAFTDGLGTVDAATRQAEYGCGAGDGVADCATALPLGAVEADADFGSRFGTGCAGDSGGTWATPKAGGGWATIGVNRSPGKRKVNGEFIQDDDTTFSAVCDVAKGGFDACQSYGSSIATLYPMRKEIKEALAGWKPGWAAKVVYDCEPPTLADPTCGAGCKLCASGPGQDDCYPAAHDCGVLERLPGDDTFVCGDR